MPRKAAQSISYGGEGGSSAPRSMGEGAVHASCHCYSARLLGAERTDNVGQQEPTPLLASLLTGELWVAGASALLPAVAQAALL